VFAHDRRRQNGVADLGVELRRFSSTDLGRALLCGRVRRAMAVAAARGPGRARRGPTPSARRACAQPRRAPTEPPSSPAYG
jgi:hypothetical protein